MANRYTDKQWKELAKKVHNNKFKYTEKYINSRTKIKIICPIHGEFKQLSNDHLRGFGCKKCANEKLRILHLDVIERAKKVHNNIFKYKIPKNYKIMEDEIIIICNKHGEFKQTAHNHIHMKTNCPICDLENRTKNKKQFILESNKIHNNLYNYNNVNYINNYTSVIIRCLIHGDFLQRPKSHLSGQGCPICNESKGEKQIKIFLKNNNIKYIKEKKFDDCKHKRFLSFDFYLPEYNTCIEFDGIQHFKDIKYFGGINRLEDQLIKDNIKNQYCKAKNIDLIRIKYDDDINNRLISILK